MELLVGGPPDGDAARGVVGGGVLGGDEDGVVVLLGQVHDVGGAEVVVGGLGDDDGGADLVAHVEADQLAGRVVVGQEGVADVGEAGVAVRAGGTEVLLDVKGRHLTLGGDAQDVGNVGAHDVGVAVAAGLGVGVAGVQAVVEADLGEDLLVLEVHGQDVVRAGHVQAVAEEAVAVVDDDLQGLGRGGVGTQDQAAGVEGVDGRVAGVAQAGEGHDVGDLVLVRVVDANGGIVKTANIILRVSPKHGTEF